MDLKTAGALPVSHPKINKVLEKSLNRCYYQYMNTSQAQIKVNIPLNMKEFLESKASKFGMPVAGYIKHLILKDIEDMDYPTYQASDETENAYKKAMEDNEAGKTIKVKDIDDFFEKL